MRCPICNVKFNGSTLHYCDGVAEQLMEAGATNSGKALRILQEQAFEYQRRQQKQIESRAEQVNEMMKRGKLFIEAERNRCRCGQPGKHSIAERPGKRCDACEAKHWRETFEAERKRWTALTDALGMADRFGFSVPHVDEVQAWAMERIQALRTDASVRASENLRSPAALLYGIEQRKGEDWNKAKVFVSEQTVRDMQEYGPGLVSKYPDATPAAKLEEPLVLSVDDGRWDD